MSMPLTTALKRTGAAALGVYVVLAATMLMRGVANQSAFETIWTTAILIGLIWLPAAGLLWLVKRITRSS